MDQLQEVKQAMTENTKCDICGKERNPETDGPFWKSDWHLHVTRHGSIRTVCGDCQRRHMT